MRSWTDVNMLSVALFALGAGVLLNLRTLTALVAWVCHSTMVLLHHAASFLSALV